MPDFLSIDCVIEKLISNKTLRSALGWKRTVPETKYYYADFFREGNNSMITFTVYIKNDIHCISKTSFLNQSRYFKLNMGSILDDCAIGA
jgi:hypothetical protein